MNIKIELPGYEGFDKVRVKLDKPELIKFKDGRKNNNLTSLLPISFRDYEGKEGIYVILKKGKVGYVGMTSDLFNRMQNHKFLISNKEIKFVYFLELKDKYKRYFYEIFYKYYYFGRVVPEPKIFSN